MVRDFNNATGAYAGTNSAVSGTHIAQGVECSVTHCYYNEGNKNCTAGQIHVGPTNATTTDDTICATFKKK